MFVQIQGSFFTGEGNSQVPIKSMDIIQFVLLPSPSVSSQIFILYFPGYFSKNTVKQNALKSDITV